MITAGEGEENGGGGGGEVAVVLARSGENRRRRPGTLSILAATAADRDVAESATVSPVTPTGFAEVTRLREVVVVVVAELGVGGVTAWTGEVFWFGRWRATQLLWLC